MRAFFAAALSLSLLAPPALAAQGEETEAGDTAEVDKDASGPLRDRIRPVSGHVFLHKGRFEISPLASVSLKDPFFTKYVFGAALLYHPWETVAIGVRGAYSIPTVSSVLNICSGAGCGPPIMNDITGRAPGEITLFAGADVYWAPIYGKISLLAEQFLHFDLYGLVGAAVVQYHGPTDTGGAAMLAPAADIGLGARVFVNRWLTARAEIRDVAHFEELAGTNNLSQQHQLLVELGVSFFFPLSFSED